MRVWDLPPHILCRNHLLGEHREIHALWSIITKQKKGYRNHPETRRWKGKLNALYKRHDLIVQEMRKRGYRHNSPLEKTLATGSPIQNEYVDPPERQKTLLRQKQCGCDV